MKTSLPIGVTLGVAGLLLVAPSSSETVAASASCHGLPVTIVAEGPSAGGTPGDDVIAVTGDGLAVDAGDGDDTICVYGVRDVIDAGAGDDVVDTSPAGDAHQYETVDLGPGSDQFTGASTRDAVDAGDGPDHDHISTGGGKDTVTVSTSQVDVATGRGHDHIELAAGSLGGGGLSMGHDSDNDVVTVQRSDGTVDLDLRHHSLRVGDADYTVRGANVAVVTAPTARLEGDSHVDAFFVHSCDATIAGGGGADRLTALGPDQSVPALTCHAAHGVVRGGRGDDHLQAGDGGRFLLAGGKGFDHALGNGYTGAHSVCRAEVERGCVR